MNIGKKLYWSFGVILGTVLVLLAINLIAVQREHETKAAAQRSIDMTEATSSVRFQMMQNRLHLQNYLLSGDTRDVEKMNDGEHQLSDALHRTQELANSTQQRSSLEKVQGLEPQDALSGLREERETLTRVQQLLQGEIRRLQAEEARLLERHAQELAALPQPLALALPRGGGAAPSAVPDFSPSLAGAVAGATASVPDPSSAGIGTASAAAADSGRGRRARV